MKRATINSILSTLSLIALGALIGGYIVHKGGEQVFASVWLSALSTDTYTDVRALKSLPNKNTNKTRNILCFKVTGWKSIYAETKHHIENGIIPINMLKSVSFINKELISLESNNKKIMSAQKLCE